MIKSFEELTLPISDYEREEVLPVLVKCLSNKKGFDKVITNGELNSLLSGAGFIVTDIRIRIMINHIRINGLVCGLIATNKGYYVATTEDELVDYEESLINREASIRMVRYSMSSQRKVMFQKEERTLFNSVPL